MDDNEQQKRAAEPPVPDKQIHRWKDDGGPVIDQPDDELTPTVDLSPDDPE